MKVLKIKKKPSKPVTGPKKETKNTSKAVKEDYCYYSGLPSPNFYQSQ